ncbi:hypothetical protein GCM10012285_61420 [Streptomyces kronopolitis]|uniref:Uncharacterized protein n=1 Tax=Streptomyces kronopolitis TaxID=1612435 RepID=A0ABQ2K0N0_9ACTN|nr:hypothetical protein [Streptomyces kronopolitis]GGN61909.1 hypothetical protein GCM10012285_61420 [Streptomyces kronopolitis]
MPQQLQGKATRPQTTYTQGDFVLYRDARRFWLGQPGHTFVGRVERVWRHAETGKVFYDLVELSTNRLVGEVDPDYMRLLPPADAMADVDTAPLAEADAGAMSPAAVAWLHQHLVQDSSKLPAQRD